MAKLSFVLVILVVFPGTIYGQDLQPAVQAGSASLDFVFAGLGAFGIGPSGVAGGLGGAYFITQGSAIRGGVQVIKASASIPANPPAGTTGQDGEQNAFQIALSADYLFYLTGATARVRPYIGGGIQYSVISTDRKNAVIVPTPQTETKNIIGGETINGRTFAGGTSYSTQAIIGAEFFVYPEVSLSAEYLMNLISKTSAADQEVIAGSTTVTTKGGSSTQMLGFGAAGARLHIYF